MREANDDVDGFFGLDQFHIGVSQPTQKIFPPPKEALVLLGDGWNNRQTFRCRP